MAYSALRGNNSHTHVGPAPETGFVSVVCVNKNKKSRRELCTFKKLSSNILNGRKKIKGERGRESEIVWQSENRTREGGVPQTQGGT